MRLQFATRYCVEKSADDSLIIRQVDFRKNRMPVNTKKNILNNEKKNKLKVFYECF